MSVLGQSFKSVQRAAKDRAKNAKLSVWVDPSNPALWLASFGAPTSHGAACAQFMGEGPTPEQAIESASRHFVKSAHRD